MFRTSRTCPQNMSAHATKKTEATLPALIIADDEWERHMARPGLRGELESFIILQM